MELRKPYPEAQWEMAVQLPYAVKWVPVGAELSIQLDREQEEKKKVQGETKGIWWCDTCNNGRGKQSEWILVRLVPELYSFWKCRDCGAILCPRCQEPLKDHNR